MKKTVGVVLCVIAIICLISGSLNISTGFQKKDKYYSSDSGYNKNAYVGGDAYNYIINGTYFTGYVVFGSALLLIATMSALVGLVFLVNPEDKKQYMLSSQTQPNHMNMQNELPPL